MKRIELCLESIGLSATEWLLAKVLTIDDLYTYYFMYKDMAENNDPC